MIMKISIAAEPIIHIAGLPITNSLLSTWIVMILVILFAVSVSRSKSLVPKGLTNLIEAGIEWFKNTCDTVIGNKQVADKVFPLIIGYFFFILFASWFGLLPGVGSIGIWEQTEHGKELIPLFRAPTSDLNTAIALALTSVVYTNFLSIKALGFNTYLGRFFTFRGGIMGFFVGILELIQEFSKLLAFSFRLFGNIFAGEVLISVLTFLVPVFLPAPFIGFEIFVGLIQAFVFAMLTMAFIGMAIQHHPEQSHQQVNK